jgi:predicted HTH domain antitoxin
MVLNIPDNLLERAGVTPADALLELACRLFDSNRLDLLDASRLAGLSRLDFEDALAERGIAAYRPTAEELQSDVQALTALRDEGKHR